MLKIFLEKNSFNRKNIVEYVFDEIMNQSIINKDDKFAVMKVAISAPLFQSAADYNYPWIFSTKWDS